MALQAGNRTWYNPTQGIEWRGQLLPINTFYALMCLFLFFFMALIFRLCYSGYRAEIRKAARKQALARLQYEKAKAATLTANGFLPPGILKNADNNLPQDCGKANSEQSKSRKESQESCRTELRVQFAEDAPAASQLGTDSDDTEPSQPQPAQPDPENARKRFGCSAESKLMADAVDNGLISYHL